MGRDDIEVLVVGAGPVGLAAALLLARAGVQTEIVDQESRTTTRSYACALHPRTLALLKSLGLLDSVLARGRRIRKVAFFDGETRRTEIDLLHVNSEHPYLLVLPQGEFEAVLEEALAREGVRVRWNHRFDDLQHEEQSVVTMIEALSGTSTGYIVPHWEATVRRRYAVRAQFVLGADGHGSLVRQRLGIAFERAAEPQAYAAYEFETDMIGPDEIRVVLDDKTTSVLWPLPGKRFRWTFQILKSEISAEFPEKERRTVRVANPNVDERIRQYVQRVAKQRAPWFEANIKVIDWCTEVAFAEEVTPRFGWGRCWLAGDAAHQTGPVGVQSMNSGFLEAEAFTRVFKQILRGEAALELLQQCDRDWTTAFRSLLGMTGGLRATGLTDDWIARNARRLLPCLPGTAADMSSLAGQLKMAFAGPN
jgi:2-polyprenyl-6-methoxyphenol hydroxylase-like FAD-dependent oxidoreductase